VPDNELGVHLAMQHLVQHGHRRIAFIAGHPEEKDADSFYRLLAYKAAIQEYQLENDQDLIVYGCHDFNGGRRAMKQLLERRKSFSALLVSNDTSAFGAIQIIKQAGLRIPQDIAMIGFDDLPDATGQDPPLTTVHYPIFEAGRTALSLTLDLINGRLSGDQNIRLPMHLIVRESCGCLPNNLPVEISLYLQESNKTPANARDVIVKRILEIIRKEIDFLESAEVEKITYSIEIPRICGIMSLALPLSFTLFYLSKFRAFCHTSS
jgi:hypothetical protein